MRSGALLTYFYVGWTFYYLMTRSWSYANKRATVSHCQPCEQIITSCCDAFQPQSHEIYINSSDWFHTQPCNCYEIQLYMTQGWFKTSSNLGSIHSDEPELEALTTKHWHATSSFSATTTKFLHQNPYIFIHFFPPFLLSLNTPSGPPGSHFTPEIPPRSANSYTISMTGLHKHLNKQLAWWLTWHIGTTLNCYFFG